MFRYLILDDDIRVEFGKAHEHARTIAAEVLVEITTLLTSMSVQIMYNEQHPINDFFR